jgi:hypothetical protein
VDAALQDDDWDSIEQAGDDAAGVAFDGGTGEVGNFGVGEDDWRLDRVGYRAQAGAEDDADLWERAGRVWLSGTRRLQRLGRK